MLTSRDSIGRYIAILYRSSSSYLSKHFSIYNIGTGQYTFLIYLFHNEGVTQEEMSTNLYIDKGTTAKAIKKLEQEGYVFRQIDEKDKRAYKVYLSDKGKSIIPGIFSILDSWNEILTSDFSEEEKQVALKLLSRMIENNNTYLKTNHSTISND